VLILPDPPDSGAAPICASAPASEPETNADITADAGQTWGNTRYIPALGCVRLAALSTAERGTCTWSSGAGQAWPSKRLPRMAVVRGREENRARGW
jgi:hypothetical protein